MKERILALVGAVALIAVAVVARSVFFADDDAPGGSGSKGGGSRPVVACTADLAPVCDALAAEGHIAADPPTLDLGATAMTDDAIDGWITWDPAPAVVEITDPRTWGPPTVLGGSRLAVAVRTGARVSLPDGCSTSTLTWTCVEQAAAAGVPVGVGGGATAESLGRLYPVAASLVPAEGDFANDLSGSDLRAVLESPTVGQRPFPTQLRTLQTQPGALALLVGPEGAFAGTDRIGSFAVSPATEVAVVLAARPGDDDLLADAFADDDGPVAVALRAAGVTPGTGSLADPSRAGALYQVRDKVG